jgi:hypothetical protein
MFSDKLAIVGLLVSQKILPSVINVGGANVVTSKLASNEAVTVPPQPLVVESSDVILIVVIPPAGKLAAGMVKVPTPVVMLTVADIAAAVLAPLRLYKIV